MIVYTITLPEERRIMTTQATDAKIDTIARECIALRVRMLNRVITKIYDEALRPLGLKASQANILVAAWKLGLARPLKVCKILHLDPSTLSRNVERMRAKGWLEVVPEDDARVQPFRLTSLGKRLLLRAVPAWEQAQAEAAQLLGNEGIGLLGKVAEELGMPQAK
jgi:DNA-binding MarR family transcriptional regulator